MSTLAKPRKYRRSLSRVNVLEELSFRVPKVVTHVRRFRSGTTCAVCPRCDIGLTREYMAFCDVCGQKLDWSKFKDAVIVNSFGKNLQIS